MDIIIYSPKRPCPRKDKVYCNKCIEYMSESDLPLSFYSGCGSKVDDEHNCGDVVTTWRENCLSKPESQIVANNHIGEFEEVGNHQTI